ncbi:hypothetical protein D3C79_797050 [compost metagenome]
MLRAAALRVEPQAIAGLEQLLIARLGANHQRAFEQLDTAAALYFAHGKAGAQRLHFTGRGIDLERPRVPGAAQQQFAFEQADASFVVAEPDVHAAAAVEQQLAAIGQLQAAHFAGGGTLIGHGLPPGQVALAQVTTAAHQQQDAQLPEQGAPALALFEHAAGGLRGHRGEGLLQGLQALPGALVLRVCRLPVGKRQTLLRIQRPVPVQHQPVAGLLDDRRVDRCIACLAHSL